MNLDFGDDALFADFLREVQALDDFRVDYGQRYGFESIGQDDQDVRRMIEAMAYYSARTRGAAERAMRRHKRQTLEQLFPYLLTPMPGMAMMFPELGANMQDARALPAGAEVRVTQAAKPGVDLRLDGAATTRCFRTVREETTFPLHIVRGSVRISKRTEADVEVPTSARGYKLCLRIAASSDGRTSQRYFEREGRRLEQLRLQINPRGDLSTAVRLYAALRSSAQTMKVQLLAEDAQVRYERTVPFGEVRKDLSAPTFRNPIERVRRMIHFPLEQLSLNLPLLGSPSQWCFLDVEIVLSEAWPTGVAVADESFVLNAHTIENSSRGLAQPIAYDGTRMRFRIEHPEPGAAYQVREVLGVYALDPKTPAERQPLLPSSLAPLSRGEEEDPLATCGYALDIDGRGDQRAAFLEIEGDVGELTQPRSIHIDAEWYQPAGSPLEAKGVEISVEDHDTGPVVWRLLDPVSAPSDSPVLSNPKGLDALLELHGKVEFDIRDLRQLLQALGVQHSEVFGRVPKYFKSVTRTTAPDPRSIQGTLSVYDIACSEPPPVVLPALELLGSTLPSLLATWTGHSDVRVTIAFDGRPDLPELTFEVRNP